MQLSGDRVESVNGGDHWTRDPHKAHDELLSQLDAAHSSRLAVDRACQRLYYGRPFQMQLRDPNAASTRYGLGAVDDLKAGGHSLGRLSVDTAAAMIVRAPGVKAVPVGTKFKIQKQCKDLSRFVQGVFYDQDLGEKSYQVAIDGMTTRLGGVLWEVVASWIVCEVIDPLGLRWDAAEGRNPRSLHYSVAIPLSAARARFRKDADGSAIDWSRVQRWKPMDHTAVDLVRDRDTETVRFTRSWAITVGDEKGRYVAKIGDVVVANEEWDYPEHCIAVFRWAPSRRDFGGKPAMETVIPYQYDLNDTVDTIRRGQKAAIPVVLEHENAEPDADLAEARPMQTIRWKGNLQPQVVTGTGVGQEIYNWKTQLKLDCLEELGISSAMASSTKPAGLTAGVALREWNDYANTRLIHPAKRFEAFFRQSARIVIMLAERAFAKKAARVRSPGTRLLHEIEFPVGISEEAYDIQIQAVSMLPLTVSGRLDFAKDLADLEAIDKGTLLQLLQIPDTEAALDRANAPRELAETQVERALWDCDFIAPLEYQGADGLDLLIDIGSREYLRAYVSGIDFPRENLECLRRLIEHGRMLRRELDAKAPSAPNPAAAPAAGAPAVEAGAAPIAAAAAPAMAPA